MEYAIGYVVIVFVLQALVAVRNPYGDSRSVIIATVFWPLILPLVAGSLFLDFIGWGFDAVRSSKMFYARKPTNPELKGFAITLFFVEFQMWKARKG